MPSIQSWVDGDQYTAQKAKEYVDDINGSVASALSAIQSWMNNAETRIESASYPEGGMTGQVLTKRSDADNDVRWTTLAGGSVIVDDALDSESTNPVRNDVLTEELRKKATGYLTVTNTRTTDVISQSAVSNYATYYTENYENLTINHPSVDYEEMIVTDPATEEEYKHIFTPTELDDMWDFISGSATSDAARSYTLKGTTGNKYLYLRRVSINDAWQYYYTVARLSNTAEVVEAVINEYTVTTIDERLIPDTISRTEDVDSQIANLVQKSGDTMSGNLTVSKDSGNTFFVAERTDVTISNRSLDSNHNWYNKKAKIGIGYGVNGTNCGLYHFGMGAWMLRYNQQGELTLGGGDIPVTSLETLKTALGLSASGGDGGMVATMYTYSDFTYATGFAAYATGSTSSSTPRIMKWGRFVNISGAFKATATQTTADAVDIGYVPSDCKPVYNQAVKQQASGLGSFLLRIYASDGRMTAERYDGGLVGAWDEVADYSSLPAASSHWLTNHIYRTSDDDKLYRAIGTTSTNAVWTEVTDLNLKSIPIPNGAWLNINMSYIS